MNEPPERPRPPGPRFVPAPPVAAPTRSPEPPPPPIAADAGSPTVPPPAPAPTQARVGAPAASGDPVALTPPPAGPPQFVSTRTERPRIVTNSYDHERARWGLGDLLASLGIYFFGSLALILLIFAFADRDEFLQGPWLLVGVVGPHVLLLTHLFWVSRTKGVGFVADFQLRFKRSDPAVGLALFFVAIVGAGIVAVIITEITGELPTASATDLAEESGADGLTVWLVLFAILGATFVPVVEELVYRGLFWSALEKRGMQPWMILVVTSAVFALIHLEPIRTAVLFMVGLAIGIGRLVTGRVAASIATHIFINTMAMTATLVELA